MIKLKTLILEDDDYHHSMDYDDDSSPPVSVKKLVNSILKDTKKLQTALGLKSIRIGYIKKDPGTLARYINGTMDNPYFVISARRLLISARKYGVNLGTAVSTTLVHEFAHAYFDMCGLDFEEHNEDVIEEYVSEYDTFENIESAKKILDDYITSLKSND